MSFFLNTQIPGFHPVLFFSLLLSDFVLSVKNFSRHWLLETPLLFFSHVHLLVYLRASHQSLKYAALQNSDLALRLSLLFLLITEVILFGGVSLW